MTTFRSKIDLWLILVLGAALLLPVALVLMNEPKNPSDPLITGLITILLVAFMGWLFWATRYKVDTEKLVVHGGLYTLRIPLAEIRSALPSRSLLSSPALSLDRLEIKYGDNKRVLISPKDKEGFLRAIRQSGT